MRAPVAAMAGLGLLGLGYILGSLTGPNSIFAADEKTPTRAGAKKDEGPVNKAIEGLTDETKNKLKNLAAAIRAANDALRLERKEGFVPVTKGINVTSLLVGGLNSRLDLESGRGVDPETFAALYAGLANDEILPSLQRNPEGLLEYKQKVIRMYSIDKLRNLYKERAILTGEEVPLTEEEKQAKERADKEAGKAPTTKKPEEKKDPPPAGDTDK